MEANLLGLGRRLHDAQCLFQQFIERAGLFADLHDTGFDASQIEQVVHQPLQSIGLLVDDVEEFVALGLVLGVAIGQQFDVRLDGSQRRLHFVAGGRHEFGVAPL